MPTYEEIKEAVFYAHEKPELLANIIFGIIAKDEDNAEPDEDNAEPKD